MAIIDFYSRDAWKDPQDALADHTKMKGSFQNGLLHLVYHLLYTVEGRKFMHDLIPGEPPKSKAGPVNTEASVRAELKAKFLTFGVDASVHEALIGAHLAGFAWIAAHTVAGGPNILERDKQEAIYKQNLAAVSWALWEQGSGELFPLGW
jgi:hypothetical protein